jgi:thiosulfate/3-mercaptopyruvate sulfurtransferase
MNAPFLIEPDALAAAVAAGDVVVFDARKPEEYARGHVPGAVNFSTYDVFATDTRPAGLAAFARDMAARYLAAGVSHMRTVVVYEEQTGMRAARDAWILEFLGHPRVQMLHGGFAAWRAAGNRVDLGAAEDWTAGFRARERPGIAIGVDEVAARLAARDLVLLDVRDADEHAGRDATPCCARRGRIPGSVWIEWTQFLDGGRFKPPQAIRDLLAARGVDPGAEIVPYCHRGARSAAAYYALRLASCTRVRNYIGSWHEWSARADLPLEA